MVSWHLFRCFLFVFFFHGREQLCSAATLSYQTGGGEGGRRQSEGRRAGRLFRRSRGKRGFSGAATSHGRSHRGRGALKLGTVGIPGQRCAEMEMHPMQPEADEKAEFKNIKNPVRKIETCSRWCQETPGCAAFGIRWSSYGTPEREGTKGSCQLCTETEPEEIDEEEEPGEAERCLWYGEPTYHNYKAEEYGYSSADPGSNHCPTGYRGIFSKQACKIATEEDPEGQFQKFDPASKWAPAGCYKNPKNGNYFFNSEGDADATIRGKYLKFQKVCRSLRPLKQMGEAVLDEEKIAEGVSEKVVDELPEILTPRIIGGVTLPVAEKTAGFVADALPPILAPTVVGGIVPVLEEEITEMVPAVADEVATNLTQSFPPLLASVVGGIVLPLEKKIDGLQNEVKKLEILDALKKEEAKKKKSFGGSSSGRRRRRRRKR